MNTKWAKLLQGAAVRVVVIASTLIVLVSAGGIVGSTVLSPGGASGGAGTHANTSANAASATDSGSGSSAWSGLPLIGGLLNALGGASSPFHGLPGGVQTFFATYFSPTSVDTSCTGYGYQTGYGYGYSCMSATATPTSQISATATPTPTEAPSNPGGGGGGGAPATTTTTTTLVPGASVATIATALTGTAPAAVTQTVSASAGGVVVAGNVGLSFPAGAFAGVTGNVTISVTPRPAGLSKVNTGGPSQLSPNGTILDITITDSNGNPVTSFPQAVTVVTKPNGADLAMARGNFDNLTLAYVIDANSPAGENPNHYPVNTLVIEPPSVVTKDAATGTLSASVNFIGSILGVVTNPVGYVQTVNPNAAEYSSFDHGTSQTFSTPKQFTYLQVVEPQIGDRLQVIDPTTNNYAYVNASDIGPSGPPPAKTSAGVVRGLIGS